MKARVVAETEDKYLEFLKNLSQSQNYDGIPETPAEGAPVAAAAE